MDQFNRVLLFLIINFSALAIGGIFTSSGVPSEWYQSLEKAPWTPPGWVFATAWATIMICFSIFMSFAWDALDRKTLLLLFASQWILNVAWNPIFFSQHLVFVGLVVITALTLLIGYFTYFSYPKLKLKTILILPYFGWLLIATSLNLYILIMN